MQKPKHTARVANIYFLSRIGESLRWATQDIVRDDLPADIQHLLDRLDRREAIGEMDDPASCEARLSHPANERVNGRLAQEAGQPGVHYSAHSPSI